MGRKRAVGEQMGEELEENSPTWGAEAHGDHPWQDVLTCAASLRAKARAPNKYEIIVNYG